MRGSTDPQLAMLTSLSTEDLIPADRPIRKIRVVVDTVLAHQVSQRIRNASRNRSAGPVSSKNSGVGR